MTTEIFIFVGAILFAIPFNILIYNRILFLYVPLIVFVLYFLIINTISKYVLPLEFSWALTVVAIFALWVVRGKIDRQMGEI